VSEPKWTPGPWDAMPHGRVVGSRTVELVGGTVRTQLAMVTASEIDTDEQRANTRLIAAAPDEDAANLNTVQTLKCYINNPSAWEHFDQSVSDLIEGVVKQCEAALAKARGEAQ
jgi:hypothetical protein